MQSEDCCVSNTELEIRIVDGIIIHFIFICVLRTFWGDPLPWHTHLYSKSEKSNTLHPPCIHNIYGWPLPVIYWSNLKYLHDLICLLSTATSLRRLCSLDRHDLFSSASADFYRKGVFDLIGPALRKQLPPLTYFLISGYLTLCL